MYSIQEEKSRTKKKAANHFQDKKLERELTDNLDNDYVCVCIILNRGKKICDKDLQTKREEEARAVGCGGSYLNMLSLYLHKV